jgi:TRAP-type C4-dicarboxylate transport system substrate-binding protein
MTSAVNTGQLSLLHFGETGSPYDRALQEFCAAHGDEELHSGRASARSSESVLLDDIARGRQFGGLVTTGAIAALLPAFHIADLPYVFASPEHARRFWSCPAARDLVKQADGKGLLVLAFYDAGTRHFFNRAHAVSRPEDLAGLKIRTMPNRYHQLWIEALGARPITMATSSIHKAFVGGEIDGAERSFLNYHDLRCREVAPFFTRTAHFHLSACLVLSKTIVESRSKAFHDRCRAAAAESEIAEREAYRTADDAAYRTLLRQGLVILEPDLAAWKQRAELVISSFRREEGGPGLLKAAASL